MGVLYRSFTENASDFPERNPRRIKRSSAFGGHFSRHRRFFHANCLLFNPVFTAFYQTKAPIFAGAHFVLRTLVRDMRIVKFLRTQRNLLSFAQKQRFSVCGFRNCRTKSNARRAFGTPCIAEITGPAPGRYRQFPPPTGQRARRLRRRPAGKLRRIPAPRYGQRP